MTLQHLVPLQMALTWRGQVYYTQVYVSNEVRLVRGRSISSQLVVITDVRKYIYICQTYNAHVVVTTATFQKTR